MTIPRERIINATTDEIRVEFSGIVAKLAVIFERDERLKMFFACLTTLSDDAQQLVELLSQKEQQHIDHVRMTMNKLGDFAPDRNAHDFSKDTMYFFVTSSKFDCQVKADAMDELFKMEVNYHYSMEPHHEQYERIHDRQCSSEDIREMAIDRMSRSIQSNQGSVNLEEMQKYVPNFPLGDNKSKQDQFNEFVLQYKSVTEETYRDMITPGNL